jgi:hypothetical protein
MALVRTDVSEELSASFTLVLTRATRHNIPEDTILHSHRRENLKSYIITIVCSKSLNVYIASVHHCKLQMALQLWSGFRIQQRFNFSYAVLFLTSLHLFSLCWYYSTMNVVCLRHAKAMLTAVTCNITNQSSRVWSAVNPQIQNLQ